MCGRYVVTNAVHKTREIVKSAIAVNDTDNFNATPKQKLPVIKSYTNGKTIEGLQWGLTYSWTKEKKIRLVLKLFQKKLIFNELKRHDKNFNDINKIYFSEHHLSHAASAFYPSPFKEALILTADGVGEWGTTTVAIGKENELEIVKEIHFPHSLGLLYSAFTYYTGFKVNSGEYKLMGLAPYGKPQYKDLILKKSVNSLFSY